MTTEKTETEAINEPETTEVKELSSPIQGARKAQKIAMDAMTEQRDRTADYVRARLTKADDAATPIKAAKNGLERLRPPVRGLAKNGVDRFLDGQEELINLGRKQSQLFMDGLEELSRFRVKGIVRTMGRLSGKAVGNVLDTQERLLELNTSYIKSNHELTADGETPNENSLSEFAYESADRAINTSTQILDVAKEQTTNTFDRFSDDEADAIDLDQTRSAWLDMVDSGFERISESQKATLKVARQARNRVFADETPA